MGPTALPWFRRWLQASPTTPSHADVLQIYADAQGGCAFLLEPRLGRDWWEGCPVCLSRALTWGPAATCILFTKRMGRKTS